jgi:hypothetical protein
MDVDAATIAESETSEAVKPREVAFGEVRAKAASEPAHPAAPPPPGRGRVFARERCVGANWVMTPATS